MIDNFIYGLEVILKHTDLQIPDIEDNFGTVMLLSTIILTVLLIRHCLNILFFKETFNSKVFLDKEVKTNWVLICFLSISSIIIGLINYHNDLNMIAGVFLTYLLYNLSFYIEGLKLIVRIVNLSIVLIGLFFGISLASYMFISGYKYSIYPFYIFPILFVTTLEIIIYNVVNNTFKLKKEGEKIRSNEYIEIQELLVVFKKMCSIDNLKKVSYQIGKQTVIEKLSIFLNKYFEEGEINTPLTFYQEDRRKILSDNIQILKKYHNEFNNEINRIKKQKDEIAKWNKFINKLYTDLLENYPAALIELCQKKFGISDIKELSLSQKDELPNYHYHITERGKEIEALIIDIKNNYTIGYKYFVNKHDESNILDNKGLHDLTILKNTNYIKNIDRDLNILRTYKLGNLSILLKKDGLEKVFDENEYNPQWSFINHLAKLPKEIEDICNIYDYPIINNIIPEYFLYPYKFNNPIINQRGIKKHNEQLTNQLNNYTVFDSYTKSSIDKIVEIILNRINSSTRSKVNCNLVFSDEQILFENLFSEIEQSLLKKYQNIAPSKISSIDSINRRNIAFNEVNGDIIKYLNNHSSENKDFYILINLKEDNLILDSIIKYSSVNKSPRFAIIDIYRELSINDVEKLTTLSTSLKLKKIGQEGLNQILEKEEIEKQNPIKEQERQRAERLEAERQREEESEKERLKAEQERVKAEMLKEDETKWKTETDNLLRKVSNLSELSSSRGLSVRYFYLHEYYPTSETNVTEYDWEVRRKIWNFKNGKIGPREIVVSQVSNKLQEIFTKSELSSLVFICAPASSKEKNEKRFKEFSVSVCNTTGMINGFDKLTIHTDRDPTTVKGKTNDNPLNYFSFNEKYFNKKRVVIFDDVVTRGKTMCLISEKLKSMGAIPLLAISIGRTTHKF